MADRISELEDEVGRLKNALLAMEREAFDPGLVSIAQHIPDNVIVIDREHRIRYINWTVPELTIERVMGTPVYDYVPEKHRATNIAAYDKSFATGESQHLKFEYYAADGAISKWITRIVPLKQPGGAIDRLLLISTDVTERAEAARDRDRFFELSLDMLCVATLAGFFKRVSPAFTSVLGWNAEKLLETPLLEFVHPDDHASTLAALEKLRRGERIVNFENRYIVKSGGHRTLEWSAIAEMGSGLIYAAARDVTERRELEAELRQSRKMESIGQLAGGVAHDFNNLIFAIQLNAEYAGQIRDEARRQEHLEEIRICAERAAELTKQLLLLGRQQPPRKSPVDLGFLIDDVLRMLRRTFPASVNIEFERTPQGPRALADRMQLEQVLLNLCVNARDAMPSGGRLTISTERVVIDEGARRVQPTLTPGRYAVVCVADTGVGMTNDVMERLFEPFFTTKAPGTGTGLGLSTVYGIVEQHRGGVRVESQPGRGSSFRVFLPETDASPEPEAYVAPEPVLGGTETILVAEDFEQVRRVVVNLLEGVGYRVITARDGGEALEIIRTRGHEIDIALLDVIMPVRTGVEVARLGATFYPGLRVLFTSGYNQAQESERPIPDAQLIRKPYSPNDLLARLRRALSAPPR